MKTEKVRDAYEKKARIEITMTPKEFCHWLRGVLSIEPAPTENTAQMILKMLDVVFKPKPARQYESYSKWEPKQP